MSDVISEYNIGETLAVLGTAGTRPVSDNQPARYSVK